MPMCSVVGCGLRKNENNKKISLHRLPRNQFKQKKWLEALGADNIRQNLKSTFICSLHFHESAFNKTLDILRLQDDAIPLPFHGMPSTNDEQQGEEDERNSNGSDVLRQFANIATKPVLGTSKVKNRMVYEVYSRSGTGAHSLAENQVPVESTTTIPTQPGRATTSTIAVPLARLELPVAPPVSATAEVRVNSTDQYKIKKLEQKCGTLRRKVKTLNEKIRRQNRRIAEYENIIKDFQERYLTDNDPLFIRERQPSRKTKEYQIKSNQILYFDQQGSYTIQ